MSFRASVLTLYPEMFPGHLGLSLAGRALTRGAVSVEPVDIRNSPPTSTAASTTRRPAAGPAWCCDPMCWPRLSMHVSRRRGSAPAPPDEPARQAV
jgi:hypothetical protein